MELTRKQIISNLSSIMDSMPDDACGDWRDSLAFAIKSIKVDEAYQIMYEGGSIFTSDEVIDMLEKMKKEIEDIIVDTKTLAMALGTTVNEKGEILKNEPACCQHFVRGLHRSSEVIQQKIDKLKGNA